MKFIKINHPFCDALVCEQGAQLLQWQPKGAAPVLWTTGLAFYEEGKPFRGGVPVCWPWFGKVREPSHGFARRVGWHLEKHEESSEGVLLLFTLRDTDETRVLWNHPFKASLELFLGTSCRIVLCSDCPEPVTAALHPYFYVGDIRRIHLQGLGSQYLDSLSGVHVHGCEDSETMLTEATDRIYTHPAEVTCLTDFSLNRRIFVFHQGHSDVVLWNPWEDGALKLHDMTEDAYKNMICVETAAIHKSFGGKISAEIRIEDGIK